jgi:hypothetical protein
MLNDDVLGKESKQDKKTACKKCEEYKKISNDYKEIIHTMQFHSSKLLSFISSLIAQLNLNAKQLSMIDERAKLRMKHELLIERTNNLEGKEKRLGYQ